MPDALLTNDPPAVELWLIPPGLTRPRLVGLIQLGPRARRISPAGLTPDATLVVSPLEPPGQPTDPVMDGCKLSNL